MAKNDNLQDLMLDIASAIREKKGTTDPINPQNFSSEILSIETGGGGGGDTPSRPAWTGHADAEGLRAIGWTDEDIAYYQANGVNWNEEDDQYHLVSDDNKALYGVLTASNISTYKERIVYLPKIDTSGLTSTEKLFSYCQSMIAIPMLDTSSVVSMKYMFEHCPSLVCVPKFDTSKVIYMDYMFSYCYSLVSVPSYDVGKVNSMQYMFAYCHSLVSLHEISAPAAENVNYMFAYCYSLLSVSFLKLYGKFRGSMFYFCYSLVSVRMPIYDLINKTDTFYFCYSLTSLELSSIRTNVYLSDVRLLSKESLLYIINNEATTSSRTASITLASYAKTRLENDPDVLAALAEHPRVKVY